MQDSHVRGGRWVNDEVIVHEPEYPASRTGASKILMYRTIHEEKDLTKDRCEAGANAHSRPLDEDLPIVLDEGGSQVGPEEVEKASDLTVQPPGMGKKLGDTSSTKVQTDSSISHEKSAQTTDRLDAQVQTVKGDRAVPEARAYDLPSVTAFMRRAYPGMLEELRKASRGGGSAFRGYQLLASSEEGSASTMFLEKRFSGDFQCTGISWNSTGAVIALAYPSNGRAFIKIRSRAILFFFFCCLFVAALD
ncbi:cytoplasmic dynein 2 intermediate chain 2-like [Ixodes scapularis]